MEVKFSEDGERMIITVDLTVPGEVSASGKSKVIASTHGNKTYATPTGREVTLGLNVYVPNKNRR